MLKGREVLLQARRDGWPSARHSVHSVELGSLATGILLLFDFFGSSMCVQATPLVPYTSSAVWFQHLAGHTSQTSVSIQFNVHNMQLCNANSAHCATECEVRLAPDMQLCKNTSNTASPQYACVDEIRSFICSWWDIPGQNQNICR